MSNEDEKCKFIAVSLSSILLYLCPICHIIENYVGGSRGMRGLEQRRAAFKGEVK